jgi:hypothetical protein
MASITMSANSSDDEVAGPGAGGCVGSALAVPIANAAIPTAAQATANIQRIATPFALLHSTIPAKLAPDRIRRTLNTTNVSLCQVAHEGRGDSSAC